MALYPNNLVLLTEQLATLSQFKIEKIELLQEEITISLAASDITALMQFLRNDDNFAFTQLIDICGVDYPGRLPRFDVVYHILSMKKNTRLRIKVATDEQVASIVEIFPVAGWFEREAWDMYGIVFVGHPDLRRILTDYGFEGFPLRKDFPLTGYVELHYSDELKRVVYEPVKLTQVFRNFDFMSPWEGANYIIKGGDK